jgi:transposase-like protein
MHRRASCLVPQGGRGRIPAVTKEMQWDRYFTEATTTHAIRAAIQRSTASIQALSARYGINPKTVAKWRKRSSVEDGPMGPQNPCSTVLSAGEEALIVGFRQHT